MSVVDSSNNKQLADLQHETYRVVPLSSRNIAIIIVFLAIYSVVYLFYAQHHRALFYIMTSLIVVWIAFVYCAGILAVLFMVRYDYKKEENNRKNQVQMIDESSI